MVIVRNESSVVIIQQDNSENVRHGSLKDSKDRDDVFTDGISSPDCVAILYNCIKNVEKQIQKIFSKTEETKNCQIKSEKHLRAKQNR